jgi:hypothetical protein
MAATTHSGKPDPGTFAVALVTIAVMVAGSVGPWAYASDLSLTLNGIDRDGKVTLSLGIGAAILLLAHRQVKGLSTGPLIGAALVGVVCVGFLIADLADIHDKHLAVRWGIVVDLVGAALLVVSAGVLIWQAPRRRVVPSLQQGAVATTHSAQAERSSPVMASMPADWYPDPHGEARLRYWDGSRWTEHTAQ